MLKLTENPPVSWPLDKSLADFVGTWMVAHTKSRNEKALAWQLQKKNIGYFLPLVEKVQKKRRQTLRSMLPLFSGYVFFCGDENDRLETLRTNRVANIIEVIDQQRFVNELASIERAAAEGFDLAPHKYIKKGRLCRVIAGPLIGTEGMVSESTDKTRLVLQIDMLGKATSLEIDMDMLELMD